MGKRLASIALVLLLVACTSITLVEVKERKVGSGYSVQPQIQWSRLEAGNSELWTVDGFGLQALRLLASLEDGEPIIDAGTDAKMPVFRKTMRASEVQELVVETFEQTGGYEVAASGLRPAAFGAEAGFRFELEFVDSNGLEREAMVLGAIVEGKLHLIIYSGAREHYFPKHRDEVEKLFASVKTI